MSFSCLKYWVGQKVHLGFSIQWDEKPEWTFWPAQYILFICILLPSPKISLIIYFPLRQICSCCSTTHSCPTLCNPVDCGTQGFPVHHHLLELAQTHIHWVSDAIQLSHPLMSLSPPAFYVSEHHSLFHWVSSFHQVARVLELQLQHQFFQQYSELISFRVDWFDLVAVQGTLKSLFKSINSLALSLLYYLTGNGRYF